MTHTRISSLLMVCLVLAVIFGAVAWAANEKVPVVLVVPGTVGQSAAVSDLDAVESVRTYMVGLGKVEILAFDTENPTIARFIMERKFGDKALEKIAEPGTAREIAKLVDADFILSVHAEVRPDTVRLALRLVKTSGSGEWIAGAESQITEATGPQSAINRQNAINTAASAAVSQLDIEAFGKVKSKDTPTTAVSADPAVPLVMPVDSPETRDLVAEYTAHMNAADVYAQRKDLPNVIYELRQAVDIEPKTVSIRVKLANAYSALGMTEEAADELQRVLLFKPDDAWVYNALGEFYLSTAALQTAGDQFREAARLDPTNVDARISLGNILWNQNKLDEAAAVFEEAAKIDPGNSVAHERLHKLYLARRNYALAVEHLVAGRSGGKESDPVVRYKIMAEVISAQLIGALGRLDDSRKEYRAEQLSREDYYRDTKEQAARIDEFAAFLSTQTAPEGMKRAHAHGVLCASLLSQSAGSLISYLETDKQQYSEESALLREEAKTELDEFVNTIGTPEVGPSSPE